MEDASQQDAKPPRC